MQGESAVEELPTCTIGEVRDSWARVVRQWSSFVRGDDVHRTRLHGPALLKACGEVRGLAALDLGCGEGWCSRELARLGASVVGIDVCDAMVAEARTHPDQAHQHVEYHVMDAVDVHTRRWPGRFDLVTACMSLHSMPDPAGALRAARQVLTPEGRLVLSVPHPATHMRGGRQCVRQQNDLLHIRAGHYFESAPYRVWWNVSPGGERWPTIRWSRSIGEYTSMLTAAGFVIQALLEPQAVLDDIVDEREHQRLRNADQVPYYLVVVAEPSRRPPLLD
jgi:2-polyprenyl-3-methyl-5-hydroxy-6-metoxy-1,4-benzoquinol methylase